MNIQKEIQKDPVFALDHVFGSEHWLGQRMIIRSVFKNQRTTVKSCHGLGKSYISARTAMAFLLAHKDSIVITTAPTFRQVENIIWRELRGAYHNAKIPIGGKLLKTTLELDENWYSMGLSADRPDAFQGIHSKSGWILVIADETAGMSDEILEIIEALLTSQNVRLLYIGNPTKGQGLFYESFKSKLFHKISIPCLKTPNFTRNGIKTIGQLEAMEREDVANLPLMYPQLITPLWVWDRIYDWGKDSPIFEARAMAQFPSESDATLIPLHWVEEALTLKIKKKKNPMSWSQRQIGIDCARFGEDLSVLTAIEGNTDNYLRHLDTRWCAKRDTMEVVGRAIKMFKDLGFDKKRDSFVVDDTGLGGGVTDRLTELGYIVLPINFASSATDDDEKEKFNSIKAEMFWNLREIFKERRLRLQDIGKIVAEVPTVRYDFDSSGRIKIVPKKKKKNVSETNTAENKSPDFADSLALACFGFTKHQTSVYTQTKKKDVKTKKAQTVVGNILNKTF